MEYVKLGDSKCQVSKICLGTMTWGQQNDISEAHSQLDLAFEMGVNFIDTAEMYPIPPRQETYGKTEEFIGEWSKLHQNREKIVLASKIVGPFNPGYIRDGRTRFDEYNIMKAIDSSLKRLKTDYLDLYQLHWPERKTNFFGKRGFHYHSGDKDLTTIESRLEILQKLQDSGKVKYFGISNETPWGLMSYLSKAKQHNLPRIVSIQNPYNLLNRTFEIGLSEVCYQEKLGLLAYSPLGFGVLSGKYLNGEMPKGSRLQLFDNYQRYSKPNALKATQAYAKLAKDYNLTPTTLALSFVNSREFVTSNIIGATNLEQLKENIQSIDYKLDQEILNKIEAIHEDIPNPSP